MLGIIGDVVGVGQFTRRRFGTEFTDFFDKLLLFFGKPKIHIAPLSKRIYRQLTNPLDA